MISIYPQFITDNKGKKLSAILSMKDFKSIIEDLEELEDIKLYDKSKKSKSKSIPIDKAFEIIESKRK